MKLLLNFLDDTNEENRISSGKCIGVDHLRIVAPTSMLGNH